MAGQLVSQALGALGAYGMNTQVSPIDLPPEFATVAINCFLDESGRPKARPAAIIESTANVDLGSNPIVRCYRHNKADGTSVQVLAGNGRIFTSDGATLTSRDSGYTTNNNWQFATLNGKLFAAQPGQNFRSFDETTWVGSTIATPAQPDAIHAAYGRLWALKGSTLYWSDLLDGPNFTTGASGSLDLQKIHTQFRDVGVAITSFNSQIVVLCRNSVYVLGLAADRNPNNTLTPIYMRDFVPNIGCYSRDSVVSTGDDVLFLSDDGLRALSRSMNETQGPAPMTDISALNKQYIISNLVRGNTATNLVATWNPNKAWYIVFAPDTAEVWIFDMGQRIPQVGLPRTFIWRMSEAKVLRCGLWWTDETMEYGGIAGMFKLEEYDPAQTYTMSITTGWLSLGGAERMDQFKRFMVNLTGGSGQTALLKWSVDFNENSLRTISFALTSSQTVYEFNVDEFEDAEFTSGQATSELYLNIGGNGKVIQFTLEFPVQGNPIVINNSHVFFKQGRVR